jgi:solute carrier family 13 (sodium-dependent dicarboxylate transporter), member 2/3/5
VGVTLLLGTSAVTPDGRRMAGLFTAVFVLWATEAVPVAITALLAVALQPILGIEAVRGAFASFMSPVFFFVLAMFFLASALMASGVDRRFALWLLARAGRDPRRILLALMAGTAAISTVMSDVPACAIFMAVALGVFDRAGITPGSSFGRAAMMGIPMASLIGGVATPAGSSINILGLYLIEEHGGVRVPFLSWMAIGVPMVLVLVPVAWWALLRSSPPEMAEVDVPADTARDLAALGPLSAAERKVLALFGVLIVLWIASTWVRALDVTLVALVGSLTVFLPGMRLLSWEHAQRTVGWEALLMLGGVTSLGAASIKTGLAKWLVDAVLGGMAGWNAVWVVAAISAFTVVVHLAIPIAPVINSALIPPIVLLAAASQQNPALYALPVAFTASCAFLLPLDAVPLVTFGKGYYRMLDMLRPGLVVSAAWVVWMTVLMVVLGRPLGLL